MRGLEPVLVRRSLGTASGPPEGMSEDFDIRVPKDRDTVFIHGVPVRLRGILVSLLGILKSTSGQLLSGLMVLFPVSFRRTAMGVGGAIVQLGGALMVFVVRSVVIASRH